MEGIIALLLATEVQNLPLSVINSTNFSYDKNKDTVFQFDGNPSFQLGETASGNI